jgi:SAM-dependent methyltransferase
MIRSEYQNLAQAERTHWWYAGMAALARDWLRRLPLTPAGRLLDAGCGSGGGLDWLAQFGRPCGLDLHPLALRLAGSPGGHPLVRADVQSLPFAAGSFGVLTSFDVLYHADVADDQSALCEFARVLQPGGWLLLRVPAHDWLRGAHDDVVQTRHRFSRQEIQAKLRAAGLRPVRVTYANSLLFLPAVLWRSLQRLRRSRPASDVRPPPRLVNRALAALLRVEQCWLRRANLPVGLSILALAQKEL